MVDLIEASDHSREGSIHAIVFYSYQGRSLLNSLPGQQSAPLSHPIGTPHAAAYPPVIHCSVPTLDEKTDQLQPPPSAVPLGKRFVDLCFVLAALPALLSLILIMGIINWLRSPGPFFFRQHRVGHKGKIFECIKLRTMRVDASAATHQNYIEELFKSGKPMSKMERDGDPRMTLGSGTFRASGLDEVPQIINILRGEMTLVGPRPWTPYEHHLLSAEYQQRVNVVPGLTGMWQICGKNRTTVPEMLELDLYYVRNHSFGLDLKIILKTIPMLIAQMLESRRKSPACKQLAVRVQRLFHLEVPAHIKSKLGT